MSGMAVGHRAWLVARPVAHRGLHNATAGVIENTPSAVSAAIAARYAVEVDLQVTADGEAMVYHDDALGRLTPGTARLAAMTAAQLKRIPLRASEDRMMTLAELCELVAGRVTLILELKSRGDGDQRLARRVCQVLRAYRGPAAAMSFDPRQLCAMRAFGAAIVCGIVAEPRRRSLQYLHHALRASPQFVAYAVRALPAMMPALARQLCGTPILAWTVRTRDDRERASRWADQMIFENFRP
jgi:glycerophosphoryl diester phosphodiesterase